MHPAAGMPASHRSGTHASWVGNHPLVVFFILAYAGAWLIFLPPLLAQNGVGILAFRLPLVLFLVLGSFAGPALAAVVASGLTGGRSGVERLLVRYLIRPRRSWWYLLALSGPPIALVLGSSAHLGAAPFVAAHRQPAMFLSTYVASLVAGLLTGPLGEELGWRGFALPRMQERAGPLVASLALGLAWASWHLPLFALREWTGGADPLALAARFYAWVIPFTVIATWVYNRSRGSLAVATMLHMAENAAVGLITAGLLPVPNDAFLQAEVYGVAAVFLAILTRGTLGTSSFLAEPLGYAAGEQEPGTRQRRGMSRRGIAIGVIVGLMMLYIVVNIGYGIIHGATK